MIIAESVDLQFPLTSPVVSRAVGNIHLIAIFWWSCGRLMQKQLPCCSMSNVTTSASKQFWQHLANEGSVWEGTGKICKWYSTCVNFETKLSEVGEPEKRYLWPGILHLGNVLPVMNGSSGLWTPSVHDPEEKWNRPAAWALLPPMSYCLAAWAPHAAQHLRNWDVLTVIHIAGWRKSCLLSGCRQGGWLVFISRLKSSIRS